MPIFVYENTNAHTQRVTQSQDKKNNIIYQITSHFTVYMEVGPDSGSYITLTFAFSTTTTTISRTWEIHITQHECSSTARPYDSGCLQYHTGSAGRLESFNFAQTSSSLYGHLASQK